MVTEKKQSVSENLVGKRERNGEVQVERRIDREKPILGYTIGYTKE